MTEQYKFDTDIEAFVLIIEENFSQEGFPR